MPANGMSTTRRNLRGLLLRSGAELAVIVLGVLIALWADGWAAERADREIERNRVEALRDNVTATRLRLDEARQEARAARGALIAIASWQEPARLGERSDLVLDGMLFGPTFTPEINVYDDLKSSGDLALLTNADLRQALARMDAIFERLALLQDDLTTVQQLNFDPFVIRELALGGILGPNLGLRDLPLDTPAPAFDLRVLRNLALFKLDLVSLLIARYDEATEALDAVEAAM